MAIELTGEVGRTGRPEDVTIVQTLLANVRGNDGKAFWDRRIDGRPGAELTASIEAFQRVWMEAAVAGGSSETGAVRPGSRTWRVLRTALAADLGDLQALPGSPTIRYASWKPGLVASNTAGALRHAATARERMVAYRLRHALAGAVENLATDVGGGLALDRTALVDDRVSMWLVPVGLTLFDGDGRPQSMDGRPTDVPAALWREIDRQMTGRVAVEATGKGGYRPRDGMESLREPGRDALLARFDIDPSAVRGDKRPVLAALALIDRIDRLSPPSHDELLQLFDIVAADDPETARTLQNRRDEASRNATRQPVAVGAGPSPFVQAVDQMLRAMARNYQSPQFGRLRSLTANPFDRIEAWAELGALAGTRKPWDIKREFPLWVRDSEESVEYGNDMWGNVHYGYLMNAAGFPRTESLGGAGYYQYFTDHDSNPTLIKKIAVIARELFVSWDDPRDQAAIRVGFALWDQYRFPIPRGALLEALLQHKTELNTR